MTKQDFISLADIVREHNTIPDQSKHFTNGQKLTLATFCLLQNPKFDRQKWLDYVNRP